MPPRASWLAALPLLVVVVGCGAHPTGTSHSPSPAASRATSMPTPVAVGSDPLADRVLYDDPDSVATTVGVPAARTSMERSAAYAIATVPVATWFTGTTTGAALTASVTDLLAGAAAAHAVPVLVLYDIPHRDCGHYSAGGAADGADYRAYVASFAAGLGRSPAAVIVEPDAISHLDECGLGPSGESERTQLLTAAVTALSTRPETTVYLDAGSSGWHSAAETAARLEASGLAHARGFALNVADTKSTADVVAFGRAVAALTGRAYVIDTSRNGAGPWQAPAAALPWCNPPGRELGRRPTTDTGVAGLDAYLWVKSPGVSDGQCGRGDPPAGAWFAAYAQSLVAASDRSGPTQLS